MIANFMAWIEKRLPLMDAMNKHAGQYPAPKNFNFWYVFGILASVVLVNQIVTGIWLTMSYEPTGEGAFASIEYIMRDVDYGWLLRYMHSTGASAFFIVVYMHMFRGMMYGSYQKPRELLWIFGMLIFLVLMAEAFMGYLLPWGNMSYWGAQVIISLFGAIPIIGDDLTLWIRGDYVISGATLNRFFALHVIAMPLVLVILVFLHILALHEVGSNNPEGTDIKKKKGSIKPEELSKFTFHKQYSEKYDIVDAIPFHPYYTVKDLVAVVIFLIGFCWVLFFAPEGGGYFIEAPNFEPANNLKTPEHIVPVWYFGPFFTILRVVPDKLLGMITMFAAIGVLFALPWFDRGTVKSLRFRSKAHMINLTQFAICFIALGILGTMAGTELTNFIGRIATLGYFGFFVAIWFYSKNEKTKPVPERVSG